ncbi:MAG: phasin family protein [Actinobacteria bacterium]|nr:phasin family protein [Actinomycetota bacterium]
MFEDFRRYLEATVEQLSPAKAQQLAKHLLEPDARKEQVAKAAQELIEWSQRNRDRLREFVAREVQHELSAMGVATRAEVDTLKKRVRELERAAGMTVSGRQKATATKPAGGAKRPAAKARTAKKTGTSK